MKKLFIPLFIVFSVACTLQKTDLPAGSEMYGLAQPVSVDDEGQELSLRGIFKDPQKIDSVSVAGYTYSLSANHERIELTPGPEARPVEVLNVWIDGYSHALVLLLDKKVAYTFRLKDNQKQYHSVQVAGNFNSWTPSGDFMLEEEEWTWTVPLAPGKYHYQLVINDEWMLDPQNPIKESNNIGGFNSVLTVPDPAEDAPKLQTHAYSGDEIIITHTGGVSSVIALWDNFTIPATIDNQEIILRIPENAQNKKRSFIRVWALNEHGRSNDILVPLEDGKVLNDINQVTRKDKHAQVLYFMLVDRFHNGNPGNDEPVDDPEIFERANYHGGDIAGITEKLNEGYFDELGVSMIWLSPITQNPLEGYVEFPAPHRKYSGYHGYWPVTLSTVDHRFGTSGELHQLVNSTHQNGMNIILDFVSNHVHIKNNIYQDHPDWVTVLDLPDGRKNIRLWDEQRLTTWFDTFIPSLDFTLPEVTELMSDSAMFWVQEYQVDGFRHDATKHIPLDFWKTLTYKLRSDTRKDFLFQIGETFGSRELIGSYVGPDMLDGQFDFNLYFDMRSNLATEEESMTKLYQSLQESLKYYGHHSLMGNITGNHDLPRFISLASGAMAFDEDDKEAGWNRDIRVEDTLGYYRLLQVTSFIHTIPGIPVIYYGDEIGMPGAGDPDNRRPMRFENLNRFENFVLENTRKIVHLRRNSLPLIYGDMILLHADDHTMVYARKYFDEMMLIALNKSGEEKELTLEMPASLKAKKWTAHFGNGVKQTSNQELILNLKPYAFEILNN
ncbi:MAG: alpha-amylase family glycosyl hydrolase [Bacteroidales bacterium]|jgi:glycosidase|nr:alpha-amylase family glycosyl hydrolase [Bacteroidales bacterium]